MDDCRLRSDLARENLPKDTENLQGIHQSRHESGGFCVETIRVTTPEASERIGKPIGTYLTLDCGRADRMDRDARERLAHVLSGELRGLAENVCGKRPDADFSILIVGLGNLSLTADAIGPLTVQHLSATAHLRQYDPELYRELGCCSGSDRCDRRACRP